MAGNGLLHRRFFLQGGAALAGAAAALGTGAAQAQTIGAASPPWMLKQGAPFSAYGVPSHWRNNITRIVAAERRRPAAKAPGSSRTPIQMLEGTITPAGLHYERHHNGVPDIDPDKHELMIHGMVRQPLVFNLNSLLRYPHGDARPLSSNARAIRAASRARPSRSRRTRACCTACSPAPNGRA